MRSCTRRRFVFLDVSVSITSDPSTSLGMIAAGSDARQARSLRSCLSNLLLQSLPRITHAFVLVRIRWTQIAHFCCDLPNLLAVNAAYCQARLLRINGNVHSDRQRILNRVRIAERKHDQSFALHLGAISDTYDFKFPRPAFGDALNGIVHQSARQAMQGRSAIAFAPRD